MQCKLKMSLPNGYIIQDTTELDKAGASSERDKSFSAARAFQSQEECGENALDYHYPWMTKHRRRAVAHFRPSVVLQWSSSARQRLAARQKELSE